MDLVDPNLVWANSAVVKSELGGFITGIFAGWLLIAVGGFFTLPSTAASRRDGDVVSRLLITDLDEGDDELVGKDDGADGCCIERQLDEPPVDDDDELHDEDDDHNSVPP